jgi:L-asparagine transporter-like permease
LITVFGIAAIVGAGIFSTIGKASADGGPAVIFYSYYCNRMQFAVLLMLNLPDGSCFWSAYTYSYVALAKL